jgi:hypothetical protein
MTAWAELTAIASWKGNPAAFKKLDHHRGETEGD